MTGLEKILQQIDSDTQRICEDIKNKSLQQCKDIINTATLNADSILSESDLEAVNKKNDILKRAESTAELEKKSIILSQKQQIISDVLNNALAHIKNLPDKDYFELIKNIILKYKKDVSGEVCLSSCDLHRLPETFEDDINFDRKGILTISQMPLDTDGGFVLRYGDVDINCCFSAIFAAESDRFSDAVSAILFG